MDDFRSPIAWWSAPAANRTQGDGDLYKPFVPEQPNRLHGRAQRRANKYAANAFLWPRCLHLNRWRTSAALGCRRGQRCASGWAATGRIDEALPCSGIGYGAAVPQGRAGPGPKAGPMPGTKSSRSSVQRDGVNEAMKDLHRAQDEDYYGGDLKGRGWPWRTPTTSREAPACDALVAAGAPP